MAEPETQRLFVAVFPPEEIAARLRAAAMELGADLPARAVRWTQLEQIHLTLFFLGPIETARVPELQAAVAGASEGVRPFALRAAGLGCFPDARRPKILWAGLAGDLTELQRLKTSIDTKLKACGCADDERPFHPHLTLGRATELNAVGRRRIAEGLEKGRDRDFGIWKVEKVNLVESVLSPSGSAYITLHSFSLT